MKNRDITIGKVFYQTAQCITCLILSIYFLVLICLTSSWIGITIQIILTVLSIFIFHIKMIVLGYFIQDYFKNKKNEKDNII